MHGDTVAASIVGLGVGEQHARAYARNSKCAVAFLYDIDGGRAQKLRGELGIGRVAESEAQALTDPTIDCVSIASFDDAHYGQLIAALEAGKHVFVEKPLCRTLSELAHVKRTWERVGRPAIESNLVLRSAPLYRELRSMIADGQLGEIYAIDGDYLYGRLHKITEGWRKDVEDYSVMLGGGIHLIDLIMWLTGKYPVRIDAVGNNICTRGTGFRYNDFMAATLSFADGMIARVSANFGCVHRHQHVLRVFGTRGTFIYDDAGARLHVSRDPDVAPKIVDAAPLPASKGDLIPGFVDSILDGGDDRAAAAEHNFRLVAVCAAIDTAHKTGVGTDVAYV